jgi:hypothetical protein
MQITYIYYNQFFMQQSITVVYIFTAFTYDKAVFNIIEERRLKRIFLCFTIAQAEAGTILYMVPL